MSAHMSVPAIESEPVPATVSAKVLTGVLKQELGFKGLVVTDAMDMQGLTKIVLPGEAAVRALEAGADVLLMPADPEVALNAVEAAVRDGRLSQKRINDSVNKVLAAKLRVGLRTRKLVDIEAITSTTESAAFAEHAQTAADRAVTMFRNQGSALPVSQSACFWVLAESRYGTVGRRFTEDLRRRGATVFALDPLVPQTEIDALLSRAGNCPTHVIAAFAGTGAFKAASALPGPYPYLLHALNEAKAPLINVAVGSPYLLRVLPERASTRLATFSSAPTAEAAAVRALFGELTPKGHSPVTIPGIAKIGDGSTM
jgi:beta-N-acetylhexosaminidase